MARFLPVIPLLPPGALFRSGLASLLAAALLVLWGCSDPVADRNEALREEIIEVHDRAMDKIGLMYELERHLQNEPPARSSQDMVDERVAALQEANRAMFAWMNQYQTLGVGEDIEADTRYRLEQLGMITEVSRLIDEAIEAARKMGATD